MSLNLSSGVSIGVSRGRICPRKNWKRLMCWMLTDLQRHRLITGAMTIHDSSFFGSSVSIRRWTYVRYCRSVMAQKLFSTGPGGFRRAERKETIYDLERTSCENVMLSFHQKRFVTLKIAPNSFSAWAPSTPLGSWRRSPDVLIGWDGDTPSSFLTPRRLALGVCGAERCMSAFPATFCHFNHCTQLNFITV